MEFMAIPKAALGTGELVRIWLRVGLGWSMTLNGLVGEGVLRPGGRKREATVSKTFKRRFNSNS